MNNAIKTRLALIRAGKTPEGYKKTKAGIIPQNWEIKKLSNVLKKQTKKNGDNTIHNVLTNSATQGIVCQTDYFDKQIANNENTAGYYIVKPGYFVYNPRISVSAPCGPFNRYNGNEDGIMSPLYSVYCFCDKSLMYADFLTYYFSSSKWYAYMNSIANYGVRSDRMNITNEDMDNMPIPYPPLAEQEKIVAILTAQDKVIECYEKKIEQLKRMKKYYLQNMFPKGGEDYPEIRFKGFTDPWEQRKLGECFTFLDTMRKPLKESEREKGIYPYYGASGIVDYVSDYIFDEELVLLSEDGANITDRNYPVCFLASGKYWVNNHAHVLKVNAENENNFICNSLERMDFTQYNSGMAMPKLNKDVCHNIPLFCPIYEEQKQIGDFFRNLDTLITLHHRKCEEEKKKKKALQQLLLTGLVRV